MIDLWHNSGLYRPLFIGCGADGNLPALLPDVLPYTQGMIALLGQFRHWITDARLLRAARLLESSRLIVGSTGSGKSEGELVDLVRIADQERYAVVLLDGHGPLAFRAAGHWIARGHADRLIYEPLRATDRVLCWPLLLKSSAWSLSDRKIDDAETREEIAQCFLAQRNLSNLNQKPWTKEWLEAALRLCQAQPELVPIEALLDSFRVGSAGYQHLLTNASDQEVVAKFKAMEAIRRRNLVEYEAQTGPARRMLELVCDSEIVRLRARPGPCDWLTALQERKLIVFDGGGIRTTEVKRTLFLLTSLHVIHAVRKQYFSGGLQHPLPVVLVLEEAGALDLVTPFIRHALQELRKAGLAIHLITQSSLDFGDPAVFQSLLANTPWQAWYLALSPADQEMGAKALANPTFHPLEVHFTRTRLVPDGSSPVETTSRSESFGPGGHLLRHDRRTATSFRTRYRSVTEPQYKSPQLHEQEYRTALATLNIGERFVRDLRGVHRERVKMLKTPKPVDRFQAETQTAIDRIRQQPIYLPPPPVAVHAAEVRASAADVLRKRSGSQ